MEKNEKNTFIDQEILIDENRDISPTIEEMVSPYIFENCVGEITDFDAESNKVWVNFPGNPSGKPVVAKLGRPFAIKDLKTAINNVLDIRLDFEKYNPGRPVITDIYYSILDEHPKETENTELKDIHIRGRKIIIDADTEVIIQSGSVSMTCTAINGKLVTKGVDIISEAMHNNKIKGAAVAIN